MLSAKKNLKNVFGPVAAFFLLSIYATFPLVCKFNTAFYGNEKDPLAWIWDLWWLKYSFLHALPTDFMSVIAAPFGFPYPPLYPVWFWLLKWPAIFWGEIATYNFIIFMSFFLTGIAMYCLVNYLSRYRPAAYVSAVMFTLSPYHVARVWEHPCLANTEWMLFYALSLFLLRNVPSYRNAFLCGLCFGIMGHFGSYYYVYFMIFFTGFFLLYHCAGAWRQQKWRDGKTIRRVIGMISVAAGTVFVIVLPQIWLQLQKIFFAPVDALQTGLLRPFGQLFADSARPLNYLLPAVSHPVLGAITKPLVGSVFYGENVGFEQTLFLGVTPLTLAFIAFRYSQKSLYRGESAAEDIFPIRFFSFAAFVFFVFSLSPFWGIGNVAFIPFPSYFLYRIFPMFRNYARFGAVVMMSVCVLAGFGIKIIMKKLPAGRGKGLFLGLVLCAVFFEFLNIPPFHIIRTDDVPPVYAWLRDQPVDIIAEYPIDADDRMYRFQQRIHEKRMVNGALPGMPAYAIRQKILNLEAPSTPGILKFLGADYILVHKDRYQNYEGGQVLGKIPDLTKTPGYGYVKDFGDVAVYEINAEPLDPKEVALKQTPDSNDETVKENGIEEGIIPLEENRYAIRYLGIIPLGVLKIIRGQEISRGTQQFIPLEAELVKSRLLSFFLDADVALFSLLDKQTMAAHEYYERFRIDGKQRAKDVIFNQQEQYIDVEGKKIRIERNALDPLSLILFLNAQEFKTGKKIAAYVNPGKSNYLFEGIVMEKELLQKGRKTFLVWKMDAQIFKLKDSKKEIADLSVYLSDGPEKQLLRIKVHTKAGLFTIDLDEKKN